MTRSPFDHLWDYQDPAATEVRFRALLPELAGDPGLHAQLLTQIARTYSLRGRFDEAHGLLDEVEAGLPAGAGIPHVRCLLERGRTINSAGRPEMALPLFQAAFDEARALGAAYYAVDAAHMLAIAASPEDQIAWARRAISLAEAAPDAETRGWLGPLYNNLGWSYHDTGRFEEALVTFEKALAWRSTHEPGSRGERIARWTVGRTLRSLGRFAEALACQEELARENAAAGIEDGFVAEELGELLLRLGRESEALPHFARAYALLSQDSWLAAHEPERLARLQALGESNG